MTRGVRALAIVTSIAAMAGTVHAMRNCRHLLTARPLASGTSEVRQRVSVLLPVRDEERNIVACLTSLQQLRDIAEIIVLDDGSSDQTFQLAESIASNDPRIHLHSDPNTSVPPGWLGKSWACERLTHLATGDLLAFVDADVVLAEDAISAAVQILDSHNLDLVCPYPRQETTSTLTRLIQPLLQWSWLTFVPHQISMEHQTESMAVGNGQFTVVVADSYRLVGGHRSVATEVLEDVALARAFRRNGLRTSVVDGSQVARCRMYETDKELIDGYTKSLWSAFGTEGGAAAIMGLLQLVYVVPPVLALASRDRRTKVWAASGYVAAVTGRAVVAHRTGQRVWPDSLAAPVSICALTALTATSIWRHRRGTLTWKGREL